MSKKNVLTGACGFVGSHILEYFKNNSIEEHEIIVSCKDASKLPDGIECNMINGNLKDEALQEKITKEADILLHVASWAEMNGTLKNSQKEYYEPTISLIKKALKNGVRRFVFLSAITSNPIERETLHTKMELSNIWAHYHTIMNIENYLKNIASIKMEIVILRVGLFTGKNYSLGILPILLPRLKTHLVPWIQKGETTLPLIDGEDIAQAFHLSAYKPMQSVFTTIDIVGKEIPTVKEVFYYLHEKYKYPLPHYNVKFEWAYFVARFMRTIYKLSSYDPLIVPAIVLLLEETHVSNDRAKNLLDFNPVVDWRKSIDIQIEQMQIVQKDKMRMNK